MKYLLIIVSSILFSFQINEKNYTIKEINYSDFKKIDVSEKLKKTKNIKVLKHKITLKNCKTFVNNYSENNYKKFFYLGNISSNLFIIEEENYNGNLYYCIEKNSCKIIDIKGKPYLYKNLLFCVNETETTDNKNIITFWELEKNTINYKSKINLKNNFIYNLKYDKETKVIYIQSNNDKYYKITNYK